MDREIQTRKRAQRRCSFWTGKCPPQEGGSLPVKSLATVPETLKEEKSIAEIVAENGVNPKQIHHWKKQALENFSHLFEDEHQGEKAREAEHNMRVNDLSAEVGRLVPNCPV